MGKVALELLEAFCLRAVHVVGVLKSLATVIDGIGEVCHGRLLLTKMVELQG